jgi:hypothetical protein
MSLVLLNDRLYPLSGILSEVCPELEDPVKIHTKTVSPQKYQPRYHEYVCDESYSKAKDCDRQQKNSLDQANRLHYLISNDEESNWGNQNQDERNDQDRQDKVPEQSEGSQYWILLSIFELIIAAAKWVVVVPMVSAVGCESSAEPAELVFAVRASHVVAPTIFLDFGSANWTERNVALLTRPRVQLALQVALA